MSWDSYIDNLVAQTKDASDTAHCDKACIIGLDGGAPWTTAGHAKALKVTACACIAILSKYQQKLKIVACTLNKPLLNFACPG